MKDSLDRLIERCEHAAKRDRAPLLHELWRAYDGLGRHADALRVAEEAVELCRDLDDGISAAAAWLDLAIARRKISAYAEALDALDAGAASLVGLSAPDLHAGMVMARGDIHSSLGNFEESLRFYLEAESVLEGTGHGDLAATLAHKLGSMYLNAREFDLAASKYQRALASARQVGDRRLEGAVLTSIANLHQLRGELDIAQSHVEAALEIARAEANESAIGEALFEIAKLHASRGEYDRALEILESVRSSVASRGERFNLMITLWQMGHLSIDAGRTRDGIALTEDALSMSRDLNARSRQWRMHRTLAAAYESLGEIASALEHHKLYAEMREEILGEEQRRALDSLRVRNDVERMEREREILRLQNEQLRFEVERKHAELTSMALRLVHRNEALERIRDEVTRATSDAGDDSRAILQRLGSEIVRGMRSESDWSVFEAQFAQQHPRFTATLWERFPDLTAAELKVCSLLKINLSTKEIAQILSVSTRTIEKHRLLIRRRLGLPADVALPSFLASI